MTTPNPAAPKLAEPTSDLIGWSPKGDLEVLIFQLSGDMFAIEAVLVREILDAMPETVIPGADPLVPSVINFRGRVIPLADLAHAFHMEASAASTDSRIIVIELVLGEEPMLIGLRTDKVYEVTTLAAAASEPPPTLGLRWPRELIRSLVRHGPELVVLPDLAGVFASLIAELRRAA